MLRPYGNRVIAIDPPAQPDDRKVILPPNVQVETVQAAIVVEGPRQGPGESEDRWAVRPGDTIFFGKYAWIRGHYVVDVADIWAVDEVDHDDD